MITSAGKLAEAQAPDIIATAQARIEQILTGEIDRLEALARVNKNIRAEELDYFIEQRKLLADTAGSAGLRLDALRLIVVTKNH